MILLFLIHVLLAPTLAVFEKEMYLVQQEPEAFSYQASLRRMDDEYQHNCGGTILSKNYVLTAAHCFFSGGERDIFVVRVVVGQISLTLTRKSIFRDTEEIIIHPNFNISSLENDIALVRVEEPFDLMHPSVSQVNLASGVTNFTSCYMSGWGSMNTLRQTQINEVLVFAMVNIISVKECQQYLKKITNTPDYGIFCANLTEANEYFLTKGPSGGPLICNHVLTGIISFGSGDPFDPTGGFTDVAYFNQWIVKFLTEDVRNGFNNGSPGIINKLIGGKQASKETSSYQVSIRRTDKIQQHICGGTLISEQHILTAAHCFVNEDDDKTHESVVVVAGQLGLKVNGNSNFMASDKIIIHPCYTNNTLYDIAVIKLVQKFNLTKLRNLRIQKIKKPIVTPKICTISGWGATSSNNNETNEILMQANVNIVSTQECERQYRTGDIKMLESLICASAEGIKTCRGDSGGPLMCDDVLTGIVSFGFDYCASPNYTGVYTNVSYFAKWIEKVTEQNYSDENVTCQYELEHPKHDEIKIMDKMNDEGVCRSNCLMRITEIISEYYSVKNECKPDEIEEHIGLSSKVEIVNRKHAHLCFGSIISKNHILTTANCLYFATSSILRKPEQLKIIGGQYNNISNEVKQMIIFPEHVAMEHKNDIAILMVKRPFDLVQPHISKLNLAFETRNFSRCFVASSQLGETKWEPNRKTKLMKTRHILPRNKCEESFKTRKFQIKEGMLCTESNVDEPCKDGIGEPLICDQLLVGIKTAEVKCGHPDYREVHTNVTFFRKWIIDTINQKIIENEPSILDSIQISQVTSPEQFKHQVSIRTVNHKNQEKYPDNFHFCGGSILNEHYILTSQLCFYEKDDLDYERHIYEVRIVVGQIQLEITDTSIYRDSKEIILYDNSKTFMFPNEMAVAAVIKVDKPFDLSDLCVSPVNIGKNIQHSNECVVSGWGDSNRKFSSSTLQFTSQRIVRKDLRNKLIIATTKEGGNNYPFGDLGGALICDDWQVGVVYSSSIKNTNSTIMYTDVSEFYDWILKTISQ